MLAIPAFPKKGMPESLLDGRIRLIENPGSVFSDVARFHFLSERFIDFMIEHKVDHACIEDYAFAATGRVFNIGENGGVLKHKIFEAGIDLDVIAPAALKKFATGKGNALKWDMFNQFTKDTGVNMNDVFGYKETKNLKHPVDDLIDAYYIAQHFSKNK